MKDAYRYRANATALVASGAFAGCNLFIGLSIGGFWLSLEPEEFKAVFGQQFPRFLLTIMPLYLLTLLGLVQSAWLDWQHQIIRRNWLIAIGLFAAITFITLGYHVPENLRLLSSGYSEGQAAASRPYWLIGHVPRIILAFGITIYALRAVVEYRDSEKPGVPRPD
ncbi:MAG: hypothetical protein AAF441_09775 [Pseudomonadota bacterium]